MPRIFIPPYTVRTGYNYRVRLQGTVQGEYRRLAKDVTGSLSFLSGFGFNLFVALLLSTVHLVSLLVMVSMLTLAERKVMGVIQRRLGPNVNGYQGALQPFADGLKLVIKEIIIPYRADPRLFLFAPVFFLAISFTLWSVIPLDFGVVLANLRYGVLLLFTLSSLTVYGIIFSGWASNSKYPFLGAIRSAAQMISYEVALGFVLISIIATVGTYNMTAIVEYQRNIFLGLPLFPFFIVFFVSALAETNRAPFDLPESESELVAGYNVEYSSIVFAMFFLGEYANLIAMATLTVLFFLGGWVGFSIGFLILAVKMCFILFLFIVIRAALPRYRYDQLMQIGWKIFLPVVLSMFFALVGLLHCFNAFPVATPTIT